MKQSTIFIIIYAVLIISLLGFLGWWAFDTYYPKPTPLQSTNSGDQSNKDSSKDATASTSAQDQKINPTIKSLLPFDSAPVENGFQIGVVTITLKDLMDNFSTLAYNTSRDLGDMKLWQEAAENRSRQAIILDEAAKRNYQLPESNVFDSEIIDSATSYLSYSLRSAGKDETIDELVDARKTEFLVLKKK